MWPCWYYCMVVSPGLVKHLEKKLDRNYTKSLHAVLNKSWKQHPTKLLYSYSPPISQIIWQTRHLRQTRHSGGSEDELISHILLWSPSHEHTSAGQTAKTYVSTVCRLEDLPRVKNIKDRWRESRNCAISMTWCWHQRNYRRKNNLILNEFIKSFSTSKIYLVPINQHLCPRIIAESYRCQVIGSFQKYLVNPNLETRYSVIHFSTPSRIN